MPMRDERGSMSMLFLGVVGGFMLLVVAISAYESVYFARRRGQSAADAASLAAMQAVQQQLNMAQEQALLNHVNAWWGPVNARIGSDMSDWWQSELQAATNYCQSLADAAATNTGNNSGPSPDEIYAQCMNEQVQNMILSASSAHNWYRYWEASQALHDQTLLGPLLNGGTMPLVPALLEFVPQPELGCLPYRAAQQASSTMQTRASVLATANGAAWTEPIQFPYDDTVKVRVVVHQPIPLGPAQSWVDAQHTQVIVESTTTLHNTPGLPLSNASQCQ